MGVEDAKQRKMRNKGFLGGTSVYTYSLSSENYSIIILRIGKIMCLYRHTALRYERRHTQQYV